MARIHREGSRAHHSSRPLPGQRGTSARGPLSLALLLTLLVGVVLSAGIIGFDSRVRHGQELEALAQQTARARELASELGTELNASEQLADTLAALAGPVRSQREIEDLLRRLLA